MLSFSLNESCPIYSAEATAILESLLYIKINDPRQYLIISDSKSTLQSIHSFSDNKTHPLILRIKNELYELMQFGFTVHFLWIPSHSGIDGNEYVDKIANDHADTKQYPAIPFTDLRTTDRKTAITSWQMRWDSSVHGRRLYSFAPTVNRKPWFKNEHLPRDIITMVCRLRFGHHKTKNHLFKVNIVASNRCDCGAVQTIDHLTFQCTNIDNRLRNAFIYKLRDFGVYQLDIDTLLRTNNFQIYRTLHKFYNAAGIIV